MSQKNEIELEYSAILQVPFDKFEKDFTFIVNGEEFQTNKIISTLLSPKISQQYFIDPTMNTFTINTKEHGDFSKILQLINFKTNNFSSDEIPFILEVLDHLDNHNIIINEEQRTELTKDNVIKELQKHEQHEKYYQTLYNEDIEFICKHMSELLQTHEEEMIKFKLITLERIMSNEQLFIENEDELLKFVNKIYSRDSKYSILYEYICFNNVTRSTMKEFDDIIDLKDLNRGIWLRLRERLEKDKSSSNQNHDKQDEINKNIKIFSPNEEDPFSGIFNYLRTQTQTNNINDKIQITASSNLNENSGQKHQPMTVAMKENPKRCFVTKNIANSWLMVDFKEHRIIPTHYTIRSYNTQPNCNHLKSWLIEVSKDNIEWHTIDEVNNCEYLNGLRFVHTFKIQQEQTNEIRYFRIRQPGQNWKNQNYLRLETLEIYGKLI